MNPIQRIAKNTLALLASEAAAVLLGFFYIQRTARHLGAEGFGILSFALAFTQIFAVLTDLGLQQLMVRELARDPSLTRKYLSNAVTIKLVIAAVTFGVIAATANALGYPQTTIIVVYIAGASMILRSFGDTFCSVFRAFERMEYAAVDRPLRNILLLLGAFYGAARQFGAIGFAFLYLLANAMVLMYDLVLCTWKFAPLRLAADWAFWKQSIKAAWPLGMVIVCVVIYFRIDTVMLSLMKGNTAVGLYSAAYRLTEVTTIVPAVFVSAIFPVLSKYYEGSTDVFMALYVRSFKYMAFVAMPMALAVTLLAKPLVSTVFGREYLESANALRVLIWAAALMYVTAVLGTAFVSANKQVLHLKLTVVAVVLNVVLNLIFIPRYGYVGASATTVATQAYALIAGVFFLGRCGHRLHVPAVLLPAFLATSGGIVVAIVLAALGMNILITTVAACAIYVVIVYARGIDDEDRRVIRSIWSLFAGRLTARSRLS